MSGCNLAPPIVESNEQILLTTNVNSNEQVATPPSDDSVSHEQVATDKDSSVQEEAVHGERMRLLRNQQLQLSTRFHTFTQSCSKQLENSENEIDSSIAIPESQRQHPLSVENNTDHAQSDQNVDENAFSSKEETKHHVHLAPKSHLLLAPKSPPNEQLQELIEARELVSNLQHQLQEQQDKNQRMEINVLQSIDKVLEFSKRLEKSHENSEQLLSQNSLECTELQLKLDENEETLSAAK